MIISFIGPPGSGKSTQIQIMTSALQHDYEVVNLRVPHLERKHPALMPYLNEADQSCIDGLRLASIAYRDQGRLSPIEFDRILFDVAERCSKDNKVVVLDGAPRGWAQAVAYCSRPELVGQTLIIHLTFTFHSFEHSVSRQFYREMLHSGYIQATQKLQRFCNKFDTYHSDTLKGLELLKQNEIPCVNIDALLPREAVSAQIEQFIAERMDISGERRRA